MLTALKRFYKDEEGATMVEYALMVALIAVVCIGVVTTLGGRVNNKFNSAAGAMT